MSLCPCPPIIIGYGDEGTGEGVDERKQGRKQSFGYLVPRNTQFTIIYGHFSQIKINGHQCKSKS